MMPVRLATVAPAQNDATDSGGSSSRSTTQRAAISSSLAAIGDITGRAAFWSQAPASVDAASAIGSTPPVTKPK